MDEVIAPAITIQTLGHEWFWCHEYSDCVNYKGDFLEFDSYMILEEELELGQPRLLFKYDVQELRSM